MRMRSGTAARTRATPAARAAARLVPRPGRSGEAQRVARGLPVDDPTHYGEWIADVERPAAQYRGRYQVRLDEARGCCAVRGRRPRSSSTPPTARAARGLACPGGARRGAASLGHALPLGRVDAETGFDCSGLVQWAYTKAGIELPRVTDQQILAPGGGHIGRDDLLPATSSSSATRPATSTTSASRSAADRFLHAPHTGDVVKISSLNEPYYPEEFTGGRRFDPAVAGASTRPRTSARSSGRARLSSTLPPRSSVPVPRCSARSRRRRRPRQPTHVRARSGPSGPARLTSGLAASRARRRSDRPTASRRSGRRPAAARPSRAAAGAVGAGAACRAPEHARRARASAAAPRPSARRPRQRRRGAITSSAAPARRRADLPRATPGGSRTGAPPRRRPRHRRRDHRSTVSSRAAAAASRASAR